MCKIFFTHFYTFRFLIKMKNRKIKLSRLSQLSRMSQNNTCPVYYRINKKAWITEIIFREWLLKIDKQLENDKRKILLFIDNFSGHVIKISCLKNVKIAYFPPNRTSKLQPPDQRIIALFKKCYRVTMIRRLIELIDADECSNSY